MRETINDRIKKIYDYKGFSTYSDFARVTGLIQQTASNYIKGNQRPDVDKMALIIKSFKEIDERWLLTGEGKMLKTPAIVDAREEQTSKNLTDFSNLEITEYIAQNLGRFKALATFRKVVGLKD